MNEDFFFSREKGEQTKSFMCNVGWMINRLDEEKKRREEKSQKCHKSCHAAENTHTHTKKVQKDLKKRIQKSEEGGKSTGKKKTSGGLTKKDYKKSVALR